MARLKMTKGQLMICKILHRVLKIEQHEPIWKSHISFHYANKVTWPLNHVHSVLVYYKKKLSHFFDFLKNVYVLYLKLIKTHPSVSIVYKTFR
jgi:hypothetical protein